MLSTKYYLLSTNLIKLWILPILLSLGLFLMIRPALAQFIEEQPGLGEYLLENNVEVGSEERNGYRQIYYVFGGEKVFVTDSNYSNANPVTEKEYIVWQSQIDSGWRVFMYHIPTSATTQLTYSGINVNPQINNKRVVWEGQDEGVWQIFLFDGVKTQQLTGGDMSLNPSIEDDFIVYGRKDSVGWRGVAYSLRDKKEIDITTGENAKAPKLLGGKIYLAEGKEEFPLTVEDIFVLDLVPLTAGSSELDNDEAGESDVPQSVSYDDILEELEATPSAVIEE